MLILVVTGDVRCVPLDAYEWPDSRQPCLRLTATAQLKIMLKQNTDMHHAFVEEEQDAFSLLKTELLAADLCAGGV